MAHQNSQFRVLGSGVVVEYLFPRFHGNSVLPQFPYSSCFLLVWLKKMGPATSPDIFGLIGLKKGIIIPDMLFSC